MSKKVQQVITNIFIKALEENTVPWRRPWKVNKGLCRGWNNYDYRGVNALLVGLSGRDGPFITPNQLKKAGGNLKDGEKGQYIPIVFWKFIQDKKDPDRKIPFMRFYQVYCAQTQCENLTLPKWAQKVKAEEGNTNDHTNTTPVKAFEEVYKAFDEAPILEHGGDRAYYVPFTDRVVLPEINAFVCPEEYASTGFHELVHSTGHESRLKRFQKDDGPAMFGSQSYSKEELVAEIGSAMLMSHTGIEHEATLENSKAYVKNWLKRLKDDPSLITWAAGRAQKAVDHITGYVPPKRDDD